MLGNTGTLAFRHGRVPRGRGDLATAYRKQRAAAGDSAAVAASMGLYGAALTTRAGRRRRCRCCARPRQAVALAGPASP